MSGLKKRPWTFIIAAVLMIAAAAYAAKITDNTFILGDGVVGTDKELQMGDGRIKWNGPSAKLQFANDGGSVFQDIGGGDDGGSGGVNVLTNPGLEAGTTAGWNNVGGGTLQLTTAGADVGFGGFALDWDGSANNDAVVSDQIAVPSGLLSQNCLARIWYKGADPNIKLQAIDGSSNILGEQVLAVSAGYRVESVSYICPSSGTMALRLIGSANTAQIFIDNAHLGENFLVGQVSQAEEYGSLIYPGAASCEWSSTAGSFASYAVDADCLGDSSTGKVSLPSTDVPGFNLTNLEPGKYQIIAQGGFESSDEASVCRWRVHTSVTDSNGKDDSGIAQVAGSTDNANVVVGYFTYSVAQSSVDFDIQVQRDSGAGNCVINNDTATDKEVNFIVNRFPLSSQLVLRDEQINWHVDANQGGAAPSLGTGSVASYTVITDGSLDTVVNLGSLAVLQACSGTEAASGLTCSADEAVGISMDIPAAGKVKACATFSWNGDVTTGAAAATFQIVETGNADQIIVQEGTGRPQSTHEDATGGSVDGTIPFRVCGTLTFASVGRKTIKLFYEQVATGTVNDSILLLDRAAANGQRDLKWEVYPVNHFRPAPNYVDSMNTPGGAGSSFHFVSARFDVIGSTSCNETRENGGWVDTTGSSGAGICDVTINSGVFSAAPVCSVTSVTAAECGTLTASSASALTMFHDDCAGVGVNGFIHVMCHGPR